MDVLLLDDERRFRILVTEALHAEGIEVAPFSNVPELVMKALVDGLSDSNHKFKVALLDLSLYEEDGKQEQCYQGETAARILAKYRSDILLISISTREIPPYLTDVLKEHFPKLDFLDREKVSRFATKIRSL